MLPILIGSNALKEYGFSIKSTDFDLIVDKELAKEICYLADKKDKNICWFGENKVDLHQTDISSSNELILKDLNQMNYECNMKIIKLFNQFDVIVAPLEILYSIKKSHIHRILPITNHNAFNCQNWHKHMNYYIKMRNKLGYEKMDNIIYGEKKYGMPLDTIKYENESYLDYLTRIVFVKRFEETNKKLGDTKVSMNKNVNQFFDDNVERFIEHDELHKKVGQLYRGMDEQLFHKFQLDKEYANLDKELFFNGEYKDRIQLFREEIIVLFLERKIIPELMLCYKKPRIKFNGFDEKTKKEEFYEIIAHFVTNLCDNGHSWLRQYILDHYETYLDYDSYDMPKIFSIACNITNIYNEINNQNIEILKEQINDYNGYNKKYIKNIKESRMNEFSRKWSTKEETIDLDLKVYTSSNETKRQIYNMSSDYFMRIRIIRFPENIKYFLEKMQDELWYYCKYDENILYSPDTNIGLLIMGDNNYQLFNLKFSHSKSRNNIIISINVIDDVKNNEYSQEFNKKFKIYYYHSDDCTEQPPEEREAKYLSTFGYCPGILGNFSERLARIYLGVRYDEYGSGNYSSGSDAEYDGDNVYN